MGQGAVSARCCREEPFPQDPVERDTDCACSSGPFDDVGPFPSALNAPPRECCKAYEGEPYEIARSPVERALEALRYEPLQFDASSTIDDERSHERYSKIMVHSTRARTQRRSKPWEEWVRAAVVGRPIVLLDGFALACQDPAAKFERRPAVYSLDRGLTRLLVDVDEGPISINLECIQVICPAADFLLFLERAEALLDEAEKKRAVMLQFSDEDCEGRRICFLEESPTAKENFVQALTAIWLEKRNDHSMWF